MTVMSNTWPAGPTCEASITLQYNRNRLADSTHYQWFDILDTLLLEIKSGSILIISQYTSNMTVIIFQHLVRVFSPVPDECA